MDTAVGRDGDRRSPGTSACQDLLLHERPGGRAARLIKTLPVEEPPP
jgi:hypothetical protein